MIKSIDIDKLQKGDTEVFHNFFADNYPQLMAFACRFVEPQTAEDLVQDVFLLYLEQRKNIQTDNIQAFFYKALKNKCLDHLKHLAVVDNYESRIRIAERRVAFIEETTDINEVFSFVANQDIREQIETSVDKLPERCAQAFRLCYFHDISQKEVADIMNISLRTVESHIRRAVLFLRNDLNKLFLFFFMFLNTK